MADLHRPLSEVEFLAFDLETTGLWPIACRIVEFGAVRFRLDGTVLDQFEQLADPGCPIPEEVTGIHGITDAMVRGQPTVAEVLPRFLGFLGTPDTALMAHNASFDLGFLGVALAKAGLEFPTHRIIDTLDLAQTCLRGPYSYRLEDVAVYLGVADCEDHRALSDSRLLAGVFQKTIARVRRLRTVGDLFRLSRPLSFADGGGGALEAPAGFEKLTVAIKEQRTVVMVYEGSIGGPAQRRVTPRGLLQSRGRAYMTAYCHVSGIEKTYRLDRIREFYIEEP
jgi:DNA polymerase-3 subunit epsilon